MRGYYCLRCDYCAGELGKWLTHVRAVWHSLMECAA